MDSHVYYPFIRDFPMDFPTGRPDGVDQERGQRGGAGRRERRSFSNMACWKIHHLWMIFPAGFTSIETWDFPASHVADYRRVCLLFSDLGFMWLCRNVIPMSSHDFLGMVNIPAIYGDDWRMVIFVIPTFSG